MALAFRTLLLLIAVVRAASAADLGQPKIRAIPVGVNDPGVQSLFEQQYPPAYDKLKHAVRRLQATIEIQDAVDGQGSGSQDQKLARYDNYVIFHPVRSSAGAPFSGQGALFRPGEAARVENATTKSASLVFLGPDSHWRVQLLYGDRIRSFVDAAYCVAGYLEVFDEVQHGGFQYLKAYRDPADRNLLVAVFSYNVQDVMPGPKVKGTATIVFNTNKEWAIEQFQDYRAAPYGFVIRGLVETAMADGIGRVPTRVVLEHYYGGTTHSNPEDISGARLYRRTSGAIRDTHRIDRFDAQMFSLDTLGVSNLAPHRPWLVWICGNIAFLSLFSVVFFWFRRFRKRRHVAP